MDIIDVPIDDLSPVSQVHAFTHLSLQGQIKGCVNFTALEQLRQCHFTWWRGVKGIFECSSLEKLDIRGVKEVQSAGRWVIVDGYHRLVRHRLEGKSVVPVSLHEDELWKHILVS